ncbi:MAG: 2-hydroxychromene-2-carboxylate isomerase [Pseudomonadota bacterium]
MSVILDYYYIGQSPFAYLGHAAIRAVAEKHGAKLHFKPVNLMGLWEVSGAVMPAQRPAVRQRYRLLELQRMSEWRGLPLNVRPAHFPTDITLADLCTIAIIQRGEDPADYMDAVFRGVWADEADMGDEAQIADRLAKCDFDPDSILTASKTEEMAAIRAQNTQDAIAADAVGVPAYVLNGEVFWGQDRIELVDRALETGRAAFTSDLG